jgi:hypothetical protein
MTSGRSKLSFKERDAKLTFQRNVPTFLKQYSHLLGTKKSNSSQDDEPQYEREYFKSVEEVIADGAQIAINSRSEGRHLIALEGNEEDDDEDFAKIRALYESEKPKSECSNQSKEVENKSIEIEDEVFDPSKKIVFSSKRKATPLDEKISISAPVPCDDTSVQKKKTKAVSKNLLSFEYDE